eukprot:scaffold1598_cov285-Prasinococcus_capsulatus_cf.AAC.4
MPRRREATCSWGLPTSSENDRPPGASSQQPSALMSAARVAPTSRCESSVREPCRAAPMRCHAHPVCV